MKNWLQGFAKAAVIMTILNLRLSLTRFFQYNSGEWAWAWERRNLLSLRRINKNNQAVILDQANECRSNQERLGWTGLFACLPACLVGWLCAYFSVHTKRKCKRREKSVLLDSIFYATICALFYSRVFVFPQLLSLSLLLSCTIVCLGFLFCDASDFILSTLYFLFSIICYILLSCCHPVQHPMILKFNQVPPIRHLILHFVQ